MGPPRWWGRRRPFPDASQQGQCQPTTRRERPARPPTDRAHTWARSPAGGAPAGHPAHPHGACTGRRAGDSIPFCFLRCAWPRPSVAVWTPIGFCSDGWRWRNPRRATARGESIAFVIAEGGNLILAVRTRCGGGRLGGRGGRLLRRWRGRRDGLLLCALGRRIPVSKATCVARCHVGEVAAQLARLAGKPAGTSCAGGLTHAHGAAAACGGTDLRIEAGDEPLPVAVLSFAAFPGDADRSLVQPPTRRALDGFSALELAHLFPTRRAGRHGWGVTACPSHGRAQPKIGNQSDEDVLSQTCHHRTDPFLIPGQDIAKGGTRGRDSAAGVGPGSRPGQPPSLPPSGPGASSGLGGSGQASGSSPCSLFPPSGTGWQGTKAR